MDLTDITQSRRPGPVKTPIGPALGIPLIYVVAGTAYILVSGFLAETFARDTHQLAIIESTKGLVFVLVTGALLFVLCLFWVRRLHAQTLLLLQQERKAMAGMASASIAHDLNNLLTVLYGLLDELREQQGDNQFLAKLGHDLEAGIHQMTQLSRGLVDAARQLDTHEISEVELSSRLHRVIKLISRHPDVSHCTLRADDLCIVSLRINSTLFDQAVANLVINAAQATGAGGTVEISLRRDGGFVVLQVDDSGPGIAPSAYDRIFSPGFTTKQHGSGLGLLSVRAFAESCSGEISVVSSRLGGTTFKIRIPDRIEPDQAVSSAAVAPARS